MPLVDLVFLDKSKELIVSYKDEIVTVAKGEEYIYSPVQFSRPQPGFHLTNSPWLRIIKGTENRYLFTV